MSEAKHIIDILTKLKESEGWEYLTNKILQEDILKAALDMAKNDPMSSDEFNFRRGSMFASNSFIAIPDKIISQYEGQLHWDKSLEEAKEKDEN